MPDPLIPSADSILSPTLDKMYELRPSSFQHINLRSGVYWHPFLGYRAQAARVIRKLAGKVEANRLSTGTGTDLLEYVASEYDAVPDTSDTTAVGLIYLTRTATHVIGDIPAGTRFVRQPNLLAAIPLEAAEYETLVPVHFGDAVQTVGPIPIRAVTAGTKANHPIRSDDFPHGVVPAGSLFDPTITVSLFEAAGGSDGYSDAYVRRYAKAYSVGQYGPTAGESQYGALKATGVRNMLVYDVPGKGTQKILVADASWGSAYQWAQGVQQSLFDNDLIGFGCKVQVERVRNKVISLEVTVTLRDANYAKDTTAIDLAIGKAARSYFDDRPDWNVWKVSGLKGAIARSNAKIFNCTSVTVRDVTGAVLSEISSPDYTQEQFHYYLANNALTITYETPI